MKYLTLSTVLAVGLAAGAPAAAALRQFTFEISGFASGGVATGSFAGIDRDGDGRLYSASPLWGFVHGLPFGDEFTRASVSFRGFDDFDDFTQSWDASVTPIDSLPSSFFGFAYDLDGGDLGDGALEGISFAPFSPSVSLIVGPLFSVGFTEVGEYFDEAFTVCGTGFACGGVLGLDPDPDNPRETNRRFAETTTLAMRVREVPEPAVSVLAALGLGAVGVLRRRKGRAV
jgi:hypothetical protein